MNKLINKVIKWHQDRNLIKGSTDQSNRLVDIKNSSNDSIFNMKSKYWLAIKNHHAIHHYQYPELGFGVSQPAWDYVFGTTYPSKEKSAGESSAQSPGE